MLRLAPLLFLLACHSVTQAPADTDVETDHTTDTDISAEFDLLDPARCATTTPFERRGFDPAYAVRTADLLSERLLPLLTVLAYEPVASAVLAADPDTMTLSSARRTALTDALSCGADTTCVDTALVLGASEVAAARARLVALFGGAPSPVLDDHLKPSGALYRWSASEPAALITAAYDDEMTHLAALTRAYVVGLPQAARDTLLGTLDSTLADDASWLVVTTSILSAGMRLEGRDEGARYEPIETGENAAAIARMPSLHWDRWRFAAIVVPGQGPNDPETALNPAGIARLEVGVARWRAGLAPFLMPSGGHVHPDRTAFSEAIEMKRYLMETLDVPEDAILVDPYARHTTTNLRDATRMLLHYGMPVDAPVLVTSDTLQSAYIATLLAPRCLVELGYLPWRVLASLTANDSCVRASPEVLFLDASDPLDP